MATIHTVKSLNDVPIRLTAERWAHMVESHDYMAGYEDSVLETVAEPEYVVKGWEVEKLACRYYEKTHLGAKWLIAIYKETSAKDGSIVSAFMTSNIDRILRRGILWKR